MILRKETRTLENLLSITGINLDLARTLTWYYGVIEDKKRTENPLRESVKYDGHDNLHCLNVTRPRSFQTSPRIYTPFALMDIAVNWHVCIYLAPMCLSASCIYTLVEFGYADSSKCRKGLSVMQ